MSATALASAQDQIKVIYDPRPDAGIPREARFAGTKPDSGSKTNSTSGVTFSIVTDLKDWRYGRSVYRDPDMKWWFTYGW